MKVLLPISLDRVTSPIPTLLRAVVRHNPEIEFYSFSNPVTDEDQKMRGVIWELPNLTMVSKTDIVLRKYDFVHHASASKNNYRASRIARIRGMGATRHVFTANCQPYPTHQRRDLLIKCVKDADVVISVSQIVADDFAKAAGRKSDAVIPNGFDPEFYSISPQPTKHITILQSDSPYVLFASAFIDRKKPEFILDLAARMPETKFVMVGATSDHERVEKIKTRAAELGNVQFVGMVSREQLRDLMQGATAMAYPSEYEGLPLTVIEAMGTGLPVIAQPKSSLPELITHGENGWLADIADIGFWKQQLTEISQWSPDGRAHHSSKTRDSVERRYSWKAVGEAYGPVYEKFLVRK